MNDITIIFHESILKYGLISFILTLLTVILIILITIILVKKELEGENK